MVMSAYLPGVVYSVVGRDVDHRAVLEGFSSASELMAMTADGDWGLDVVYEAPDGLRPDMLLPESLSDIENAEGRGCE